jgi:hypothetical protein
MHCIGGIVNRDDVVWTADWIARKRTSEGEQFKITEDGIGYAYAGR